MQWKNQPANQQTNTRTKIFVVILINANYNPFVLPE